MGANSTSSLTFRLLGKDESASKTIRGVGDASDKTHGKLGRLGDAFGGVAKKAAKIAAVGVGAGILALGAAAHVGFGEIKASSAGIAQTNAVLASTKGVAGVTQKQIESLAGTVQKYSGIEDDAVRSGENMLLTFTNVRNGVGKNNDIFTQATKVMADMSVALGQDTKRSAIQLGKALNDPVKGITALRKVGVSFTADQQKQITALVKSGKTMQAQKIILAELATEFGGSAKAFGQSLPGAMERAKRSFEDTAEAATTALLPAITGIGGAVAGLATKAAPLVAKTFDGLGKAISAFAEGAKTGSEQGLGGFLTTVSRVGAEVGNVVRVIVGGSGAIAGEASSGFTRFADKVRSTVLAVIPKVVSAAKGLLGAVREWLPALRETASVVGGAVVVAWSAVAAVLPTVTAAFGAVGRFVSQHMTLVKSLAVAVGALVIVTKAHAAVMAVQQAGGLVQMIRSTKIVTAMTKAWAAVQWLLNAAMSANPIVLVVIGIAALVTALVIAYKKSETFRNIVNGALNGVAKVAGNVAGTMIRAFRGILLVWLTVADGIISGAAKALGWVPGIGGKLKAANKAFDKFKNDTLKTLDKMADKAYGLGEKMGKRLASGILAGVPKTLSIGVTAAYAAHVSDKLEGRASGGPMYPGKTYTVGENGPETVTMGALGATVSPYGAEAMAGAASQQVVIENVIMLDGEVLYRAVQKQALRQGRRSVTNGLTA